MPITLDVASPTIVSTAATTPNMPVTTMAPATTNLTTITETEHEVSVPETMSYQSQPTTNKSQLDVSYLNNHAHQVVQNTSISMCSSNSYAQRNLKSLPDERLNDKIYNTLKEIFSNTQFRLGEWSIAQSLDLQ